MLGFVKKGRSVYFKRNFEINCLILMMYVLHIIVLIFNTYVPEYVSLT